MLKFFMIFVMCLCIGGAGIVSVSFDAVAVTGESTDGGDVSSDSDMSDEQGDQSDDEADGTETDDTDDDAIETDEEQGDEETDEEKSDDKNSDDASSDEAGQSAKKKLSKADSEKKIVELKDNAKKMKEKEQSTTNKMLGAVGIGATGIGLMQTMSASAEQSADDDAERDMKAYLSTFVCNYGGGKNVQGGEKGIELPGGNELMAPVTEYKAFAADLKVRKEALGMRPGIEAEVVLDKVESGLYDDVAVGKTGGAYTSVARALMDDTSADAAAWAQQKKETADKKKQGMTLAAVGAIGSAVGNIVLNRNAPKERSDEINDKYDKKDYENAHTNVVLKNSVTEPVVESYAEESVLNVVGNTGMADNTANKDVLDNVGVVTSNQDVVIIAEADFFSDDGLTPAAKEKIDELWSQITGRVCKFEVELVSPHYKDFDKEVDIVFAKQKLLESYFVAKQKPANIQVDVLVSRRRGGGCENNTTPCPNVEIKLDCFADTDVESVASEQTVWRPLESDWRFDQTVVEGTIYQSATRGEYSEYLSKARNACNDAHGTWREDIKVYTVMKNKDGKFNTYVDATCDFGTEDKSSGSKRCANMCKKAKIKCTQSGGFGYNNYTSCFILPPDNE